MILNDNGNNNLLDLFSETLTDRVVIQINGDNNRIKIAESVLLPYMNINILGHNNSLIIEDYCNLRGNIHIRHGSITRIKAYTTAVEMNLFSLEGKSILIGQNCMFSSRVYIRNSDEHSIIDVATNARINPAQDVIIGDHVWLGDNVTVNKGVKIAEHSIVGSGSTVSKDLATTHGLYVGMPAELKKQGVTWRRELI